MTCEKLGRDVLHSFSRCRRFFVSDSNNMRIPALILLMTTWCLASVARADDSAAINKLIEDINAAAKTNKARMLKIMVINTDVAAATLESERSRTGLSLGDVYVAHSLGLATHKSFDQIVALQKDGQSWAKIAQTHKVSLRGSSAALREMLKE